MHVPYPVFLGLRLRILGAFTGVLCRLIGRTCRVLVADAQRAQYPLIKEYGLKYIGLEIMIQAIFLNQGVLGSLGAAVLN